MIICYSNNSNNSNDNANTNNKNNKRIKKEMINKYRTICIHN